MSVYNGEAFLHEAIESILRQTFQDFEFLIIDDASSDSTIDILQASADKDSRIRIERNSENLGLTKSLNKGLKLARGEFIARLDADDVALPDRLEKQLNLMRQKPDLAAVGTACKVIDRHGDIVNSWTPPSSYNALRWSGLFISPFPHSSVMIRRSIFTQNHFAYDEDIRYCQDFDLWARIMSHHLATSIRQPLILLRRHDRNITSLKSEQQKETANTILARHIQKLLPERQLNEDQLTTIRRIHLCLNNPIQDQDFAAAHVILDLFQSALNNWDNAQDDLLKLRHRFIKLSMRACGIRHISTLIRSDLALRIWKTDWRAALSFFS
jgi:glycosyltransferase involved in cell wall biosynthesis